MMLEGAAECFGDDVNTDVVLPGKYIKHMSAPERHFHERQGAEGVR